MKGWCRQGTIWSFISSFHCMPLNKIKISVQLKRVEFFTLTSSPKVILKYFFLYKNSDNTNFDLF